MRQATEVDWEALEKAIGYRFSRRTLLVSALTHSSHRYEQEGGNGADYERMEYLGDALLGFLVAEWFFNDDEAGAEGTLSRRRQSIVRESTLATISAELGLGQAMLLGRGEELSGGRLKRALLADLFESVLAAIYLDAGIEPARRFVLAQLGPELQRVRLVRETADDYKTRLQERLQGRLQLTPHYRIVSTSGPAHALHFEVEVMMDDQVLATGSGSNRKRAEQAAARRALAALSER